MNGDKMLCPRCGEEMKTNARYCMKCGYLNYNHPENVSLKPYMGKLQETSNYVNGNLETKNFIDGKRNHEIRFGSKTGNKYICFFINFTLYLLCLALTTFLVFKNYEHVIDLIYSCLPYLLILVSLCFIYIYAIELTFMKMNVKWWVPLIPFYNMFVLSYKGMGNYLYGLLFFIPIVGQIYSLVLTYKIGTKFGFNGFMFMLFWPIYVPVMGFGSNSFEGITYINGLENTSIEKEYKLKISFISTAIFILVSNLGLVFYLNRSVFLDPISSLENYYYVYASRAIVNRVKTDIKFKTINCDDGFYSNEDGDYYFYDSRASSSARLLFRSSRDEISSYVKIVNKNNDSKYYISLTDGKKGIEEKEVSKIGVKDVKKMKNLPDNYKQGNNCRPKV